MPSTNSKEEEEKRLGYALRNIKIKLKLYEGKEIDEIENIEDRRIIEKVQKLDEEYGKSESLKNILEIENWCQTNYGDKEIWEKKLPSGISKNEEEKRLGKALGHIRTRLKQYEGKEIEEIENIEDRRIIEKVQKLDEEYGKSVALKNILEIESWCQTNYGDKKRWKRKLPSRTSKNEVEKRLGESLKTIRRRLKLYEGKEIDEIENIEDKKTLKKLIELDKEYNSQKIKTQVLQQAKATRDKAKNKNNEARKLEQQVSEQLMKRGKTYDEK